MRRRAFRSRFFYFIFGDAATAQAPKNKIKKSSTAIPHARNRQKKHPVKKDKPKNIKFS
jgi:hypothetical protein